MKLTITGDDFQDIAKNLLNLERITTRNLQILADNVVQRVKARIFTGRGTEGVVMTTKSRNRIGRYGAWHGGNRLKKSLQVDVVDLDYTGTMLRNFDVIDQRSTSIAVGFKSDTQAEKMEENEQLFGMLIADVEDSINDSEIEKFFERIDKELGI